MSILKGVDEKEFRQSQMIQDAVVRRLEVIGEACSNLEEEFKDSRPNIPWKEIVGMRNRLAHEYWDIDLEIVWQTATQETPALKQSLLELLSRIGE